ncbi:hypothetical protein NQ314_021214 [Rhamnusium bicolor]|uniref:Tetraspanin n=1 Tax=Rhamnusium bicolor TaxID=1586634 RepID=A0AAV8WKT9_9CUCU|nr:hypothetical protein NQ314_021214 [Rhamnusium bicolor]
MFSKTVAKKLLRAPKFPKPKQNPSAFTAANIKCGKPVRQVTYQTIKFLAYVSAVFLTGTIIFSIVLFISSVNIKNHLGHYINMVASGDGDVLPTLQAIPALFFLIMNIMLGIVTYQLFDAERRPTLNWILFILLMVTLLLIFVIFILLFVIMQHIYKTHEELHNGIVDAMKNYSSNSLYKAHIDRMQIEFQCCGSKKHIDWYSIPWYDSSLVKKGT